MTETRATVSKARLKAETLDKQVKVSTNDIGIAGIASNRIYFLWWLQLPV
jgi:hypothetical protein